MNAPLTQHEAIAACNIEALTLCLRTNLQANAGAIPADLKQIKGWLLWRITKISPETGKFDKVPVYPISLQNRSGKQGSDADLQQLATFDEAIARLIATPSIAGIGFATLLPFGVVALDADKCLSDGELRPDVAQITERTYCEISPSGKGIRAFWMGSAATAKNHQDGIELFSSSGFVTVTGNRRGNFHSLFGSDSLPNLDSDTRQRLEAMARRDTTPMKARVPEHAAPEWDEIESALFAISPDCDRQTWIECGMALHSTGEKPAFDLWDEWSAQSKTKYQEREMEGQWRSFKSCENGISLATLFHHAADWGWERPQPDASHLFAPVPPITDWVEPHPLPDLPPVPKFELELLPESIRPWVADIAERLQLPADLPAIGAITALSGAIGCRVKIRPKQFDSWTVIPNLWGMVVAPPGYKKSPAIDAVMQPLHDLERQAHHDFLTALESWEVERGRIDMVNSATKSTALAMLKKDQAAEVPALQTAPDEPVPKRYIVNNFSLEALGEVMIGNPDGVLAFSDELYGLLMMASKTGNEELHSFLLTGWNGSGGFTFDRIGRGKRYVENVCLSVLGGIQPGRLVDYLTSGGFGGAIDSGFANRFQLLTWPDLSEDWKNIDRLPDHNALEAYRRIFERVAGVSTFPNLEGDERGLPSEDLRRFDAEGQSLFYEWYEANERLVRGDTLPPVMASHLAKYASLVPSLALIFAVADDARGDIPARYVRQAIGWANYLRPHAERAFACMTRPDTAHARALLAKIKARGLEDGFTVRDVYRHEWSMLTNREAVEKGVSLLVDHDYLRSEEMPSSMRGGRGTIGYRINPMIWT